MHIKVGTRGSKLALTQTNTVISILQNRFPEDSFEVVVITTKGDKEQEKAIDKIGSKGVFTEEIEEALLKDEIQLAVHSMKDMPSKMREGLVFSKAMGREDPRDVLILREAASLAQLKEGAIIATGSIRRAAQLKKLRPDIETVGIRGNVDTRIRKLYEPLPDGRSLDGILLAAAGVKRLNRESEITEYLPVEDMIPAPAQGILALQLREDNKELLEKINSISDELTELSVKAERGFLAAMGGDCHVPVGAYLQANENETFTFFALFGNEDGTICKRAKVQGTEIETMIQKAVELING